VRQKDSQVIRVPSLSRALAIHCLKIAHPSAIVSRDSADLPSTALTKQYDPLKACYRFTNFNSNVTVELQIQFKSGLDLNWFDL